VLQILAALNLSKRDLCWFVVCSKLVDNDVPQLPISHFVPS
jgi:hypothetical protein